MSDLDSEDPQWTGVPGEPAVVVGRGVPRRTDVQMQQVVYGQISRYLAAHTKTDPLDLLLALTAQLIAQDHITARTVSVELNREQLLSYVESAQNKIKQLSGAR